MNPPKSIAFQMTVRDVISQNHMFKIFNKKRAPQVGEESGIKKPVEETNKPAKSLAETIDEEDFLQSREWDVRKAKYLEMYNKAKLKVEE